MDLFHFTILIVSIVLLKVQCLQMKREIADETESKLNSNNDTLIFAHVLYRHGNRNIEKVYPNDPYKDEIHWPIGGIGELTNEGKQQHFKLGQYFRRRYGQLIGNKYSPHKVYVQSSDVDRTITSALANLAGLFPPENKDEQWNENISWQPIPVHTVPKEADRLLFASNCPKYKAALEQYLAESQKVQHIYKENAELFKYWSDHCGLNISTTEDVYRLYNTLTVEQEHNKTLAEWAQKAIEPNGTMEHIAMFDIKTYADTPILQRLSAGFLLKDMLERFSQKIESKLQPNRSLWIYSTHFYVLTNILNSLGLLKPHLPPYAASLLVELYETSENEHYIQIVYKDSDNENPLPLHLPKCGEKCPLNQFREAYDDIIPGDFDDECRL